MVEDVDLVGGGAAGSVAVAGALLFVEEVGGELAGVGEEETGGVGAGVEEEEAGEVVGADGEEDVELLHVDGGGVHGGRVAGEGEGRAGLEAVVVGKADDAEGLEDGVAEDGGDDVGLLLAGADGEVGVGEDEQDYVVDGGGADGKRIEDGNMERVFCAGGSLRVSDAGAEGEA